MKRDLRETLSICVGLALKPVARFCIKNAIGLQDIIEALKVALVESATEELQSRGEKVNASRVCVISGMHRQDVNRIMRGDLKDPTSSYFTRVIGHWEQSPEYCTKAGKPRILSCDTSESEFYDLVRSIVSDVPPGTILGELERAGAVERTSRGVKLLQHGYNTLGDPVETFRLYSEDTEDLLACIEENSFADEKVPNLHVKTEYDNISTEAVKKVRAWLFKEGSALHRKARAYLSKFDLDIHPELQKKGAGGVRVTLGSFSRLVLPEEEQK